MKSGETILPASRQHALHFDAVTGVETIPGRHLLIKMVFTPIKVMLAYNDSDPNCWRPE